jgi:DNA-binding GntR family transcriptional regulator
MTENSGRARADQEPAASALRIDRGVTLADQAYTKLRNAVVTGTLKPGQRLVERDLGVRMGISRTPLREAIIRLVHERIIESLPSGGWAVTAVDEREARELYAIRMALEGYATRLAALRAGPEELGELQRIVDLQRRHLDPVDLTILENLNEVFHKTLYAVSAMARLIDLIEMYRTTVMNYRLYHVYQGDEIHRAVEGHAEIAGALERHDGDAADALIREHIARAREIILERRVAKLSDGET